MTKRIALRTLVYLGVMAGMVLGVVFFVMGIWIGSARAEGMVRCNTVHVIDGDSLHCNTETARLKVRLWGIDAPDFACRGRPGCFEAPHLAEVSKRALRAIVQAGDVFCRPRSIDRYGRSVAVCYAGGVDVACSMIRQGHAVEWRRYSRGAYAGCARP